jgi:hypothetical protein
MSIAKITKAELITFSDTGQIAASFEWLDHKGRTGRTVGYARASFPFFQDHLQALAWRAACEGVQMKKVTY